MGSCDICGAKVGGSAWKCQQCGSQGANANMVAAKLAYIAAIIAIIGGVALLGA